jgi:hypothetical protein
MCWKKILDWFKPEPIEPIPTEAELVLLSFGINDYMGTQNDLDECLTDLTTANNTIKRYWPNLITNKYEDSQVTREFFKDQLTEALSQHWDTVLMYMDCCFSEDNTRNPGPEGKIRFMPPKNKVKRHKIRRHIFRSVDMKHIAFSACQDYQTASDGCFTPLSMAVLNPNLTYRQWAEESRKIIQRQGFDQIPAIQGPDYLLDKKVFSDKTLIVQYSGHGSYTSDASGDEADGQDEAMYVYDGMILDDELSSILQTIV